MRTLAIFIIGLISLSSLVSCSITNSSLPVSAGVGADPTLPEPKQSVIPIVNIAPAVGWKAGDKPTAADGMKVQAFASGLDHPRWIYRLPNGDVLVAESNKQPKKPKRNELFFKGHFKCLLTV